MQWQELKSLIAPTTGRVLSCVGLALVVVLIAFGDVAYDALTRYSAISHGEIERAYQARLVFLNSFSFVRTGVIALFWATVAIVMYIVYLTITNAIIEARNQLVIETAFANKPSLWQLSREPLIKIGVAIVLIATMLATAQILLPFWLGLFAQVLLEFLSIKGALMLIGSIGGIACNMYVLWVLIRLAFRHNG